MRHLRVWFAAAPPGGPPEQPRRLLRAGLGPGTVERESGKSRGRADWRGSLLLPRLLGAPTPSLGEGIKRRADPKPDQSWGRSCLAFRRMRLFRCRLDLRRRVPGLARPHDRDDLVDDRVVGVAATRDRPHRGGVEPAVLDEAVVDVDADD